MKNQFTLTIAEILQNRLFKHAEVVAGEAGLHRHVRWVHILEVSEIDTLVHGNEMILTTGIGFAENSLSFLRFIEKLIQLQVSGLCLELGTYIYSIPDEVKQIADAHQFPIIIFKNKVRFVDITQEIHSQIINHHYRMLQNLEKVSREFHRLTLQSEGTMNVLKLLQSNTQSQIIYLPIQETPSFIPHSDKKKNVLAYIQTCLADVKEKQMEAIYTWNYQDEKILVRSVGALGQIWAYLCMVKNQEPNEYDFLLLDSAAISLAQDLLKQRFMEERQLHSENLWVNDLLTNEKKEGIQVQAQLGQDFKTLNESTNCVCVLKEQSGAYLQNFRESTVLKVSMIVRSALEKHAFRPFITVKNNSLVVLAFQVALLSQEKTSMKERLQTAIQEINDVLRKENSALLQFYGGVGSFNKGFRHVHVSYEEATKALLLKELMASSLVFYEELGVYQILLSLREEGMLKSYVYRHLGPLIEEDQMKKSDLLTTLSVFLEQNGSKKLAADKLHIVRQSLYYRLEKIEELLGKDFMTPDKRLALQLAIKASQLIV